MFRSGFRKKGVCSKSVKKTLYRNKVLVKESFFKLVYHCESCMLSGNWLCVRDIAEKSLTSLLKLLLILKSSHRSCPVEKGVLKSFTGKHLYRSLFSIKLQVVSQRRCLPLKCSKFLGTLIFKNTCIFM